MAAAVSVAVALTGIISGVRWLTVIALLMWVAAMAYYGFGNRKLDRDGRPD